MRPTSNASPLGESVVDECIECAFGHREVQRRVACALHGEIDMTTYIDVSFRGLPRDPSLEVAVHRWVARLEAMRIEVQRADVTVEPSGRKRTLISATVRLTNGNVQASATSHADAYAGIANTFHAIRQQLQPVQTALPRSSAFG